MENPDYIIIGSGPGGTAVALKLVEAGKRVLMLERGRELPKEEANRDSQIVYGETKYRTDERWVDDEGEKFQPWMHYHVGGNAKIYGAALYRFRREDFAEIHYSDGVSPAWPMSYEEFDPYYDEAEKLYWVHGDRTADATEPTQHPYPLPPLEDDAAIRSVKVGLSELGISSLPLPLGVKMGESNDGFETDLEHFDAYPDPSLSKADPEACVLGRLRDFGDHFELITDAKVTRFLHQEGRVTAVAVEAAEGETYYSAPRFVCAAGAINSARLLLASDGLANRSDQVGRNYMAHLCTTAIATFDKEQEARFAKTFGTNHWYRPGEDIVLGSIQTQGKWDATQYELEPWTHDESATAAAAKSLEFFFMTEDLPLAENRVTVSPDGELAVHRRLTNEKEHQQLVAEFSNALRKLKDPSLLDFRSQLLPIAWCTHQCGTLRFGVDAETSVLNLDCRCHDVDNLWVTDGSFFPSSTALNPTLTIIANALRVGEILARA